MDIEMDYSDVLDAIIKNVEEGSKASFQDIIDFESCMDRDLFLGDITIGTGTDIEAAIRFWNKRDETNNIPVEERKPIKLYIDSSGGSLLDTFTIIDAIKLSKTPVWTICTGAAYSGGFFTFMCGDRRIAYPHASFLFHEGAVGNVSGTANQFANYSSFYKKQLQQLKELTLENTSLTETEYTNIQKDDFWLDAKEAMAYGICDEIATHF